MTVSYCTSKTKSLGELLLVASETHLIGVYFADCAHAVVRPDWVRDPNHPMLRQTQKELEDFLSRRRTAFSVSLQYEGTPFQCGIWRQIAQIPFGETITYSQLARRIKSPNAARAAGTATGQNPLSIVIPCHRVTGKNGALTGYAGGLERKRMLLELERS